MKKCMVCFEKMTIVVFIIGVLLIFIYLHTYASGYKIQSPPQPTQVNTRVNITPQNPLNQHDVLLNPYTPPLSDERYFIPQQQRGIPINISTNIGAVDTSYRQIGILTPKGKNHSPSSHTHILPLLGRPLFTSRSKWQYYTMTDKTNSIKLPIIYNGRSCTNEYGCDELLGGEHVFVQGYNESFTVTKYDNDTIKYMPFL
jgi:hypothetical protein